MATNLSGSLSEFTLAEVLALLSMGRRTARMQVSTPTSVGVVHLVDGKVSSATADCSRASLLRSVVAALPVPADDLAPAVGADDPVRHLVDGGVVDRAEAQQVAQEQSTEAVAEMLGWESGDFAVSVGDVDAGDIGLRVGVDELVSAAEDRAQAWADLRSALPAPESVLALVPEVAQGPVVDAEDWAVLARVDGRRTLDEVLAAMGAAPLAAGNRLVELMGRGLVSVRVGNVDVESERANQLIDQFESPAGVGAAAFAVADQGPDLVAVDAAAVAEPTAEPSEFVAFGGEHVEQDSGPSPFFPAPAGDEVQVPVFDVGVETAAVEAEVPVFDVGLEPVYDEAQVPVFDVGGETAAESVSFEPAPVDAQAFEVEDAEPVLVSHEPAPVAAEPVSFLADPVASLDEAGAEFAWSPWAQEMGLGEATSGHFEAAPAAEGTVEEDGYGPDDTEAFPAPQAPQSIEPLPVVDEVVEVAGSVPSMLPEPRLPGDGGAETVQPFEPQVGAHALETPAPEAPAYYAEAASPQEPGSAGEPEVAPDPLAGGLLAHLMSSVRGL